MRSSSVAPSRGTTTTTTHKSSSPPSPHTAVGLDILAELRHLRDSIQTTTSSTSTSSENAATGHHVATKQQQLKSTSRGRSGSVTVSSRRLNGIAEGGIGSKGSMSGSGSGGFAQQVLPNQQQQQHHNRTAFGSHQTQSNDPFNHNRIKSKSSSSTNSMDASGSGDTRSGGHPPLAPSETAVAAGDGLLSANVGVQPDVAAVKRELHRVTESYGALVREYRSAKIIWEAEDSKKSDEISRLSAGLSGADRSRRDVYEALKTAKESRLEAQREREACALYKEKAESEKKLRDSAERRATDSAEQLKTLHSRVKELSSLNEELEISRTRESAAIKRVRDSDERIRAMLKDREEMAAELSTLKNLHKEGAENFAKAKTFASMRESLEFEAKDAQDRLASMAIRLTEVEENAAKVVPLTEERDDARRHVDHLESVQSELLTAVQLQAADLSKMKEEVESHSGDAKRISRLEKALEAYRNVEKLFTQKTGQGFFGPAGLAAAAATSPIEGDGDHGATTAFAGGALASELVGEYIDRLRSSISAEVKSELSASISSERQKAAGSVLEAEMRMLEHQKAADAACSAREVLEAWKRRALAVEETVSSIISAQKLARSSSSSSTATSGLESSDPNDTNTNAGQDPLDPDIASDPLYTSEWDKLPSFVAVLPRLASAVGRLRSDIGAAIRRRRLAEIEAQDLREELACIRGDDVAAVAMHRVASNDVRNALKRASDERSNLRAEISSLTAQLSAANIRVSDLESKLVQAGSKLTSARQQRDEKEKDCISIRESLEIEKAACANAKAALATAEQRLHDAKETNERALKMLAARDAEITRMKVYGENHHGVAAHQGDTIEGGSNSSRQAIKPPPAPSFYGSVSVPNYNPSSVFAAGAAAKASANEAAAQQLEKEKEKEREEQAKIDRREKERKSLAKAARAKAEAAAVAAAAQASAAEAEERRRYAEAEAAAAAAVTAAEEARAVEAKRAAKEARRRMREAEAAAAEADALRRRELEAVTEQIRVMEARRNEEKKDTERRAAAIARQATEAAERLAAMQQHQQQQHQQQQQSTNNQTTSAMLLMQQAAINSALLRRGSRDSALLELSLRRRDSESSSTRGVIRKPSSSSSRHDDAGRNRTSRSHRHHRDREEDAPLSSPSDGGDSIRQQEHRHDHDHDHDLKKKKHSSLSSREKTETKLEDAISSSSAAADAEKSTRGGGGGVAGTKRPTSSTLSSLPERSVEPSSLVKHPQAQQSSHSSRSKTTTAATFSSSSSSSSGGAAAGAASLTSKTVKSLAPPPHSKSVSINNPKGAVETRPTATADTSFSISTPSGGEEEEEDRDDTDHYYTQHPTHLESVPEWRSAVSPTSREKPPANRNSTQTRMTGKAVIVTRPSVVRAIVDNDATVENEASSSADTTSIFAGITGIYSSSSDTVSAAVANKGNGDREGEGQGEGRGRQVRRESISGLLSAQELADTHFKTTLRSREGSVASSQASSRASSRSRSGSVGDFSRSYYHKRR